MFDFIMQQVLGMKWLSDGVWSLLLSLGADKASPCGAACTFSYMIPSKSPFYWFR